MAIDLADAYPIPTSTTQENNQTSLTEINDDRNFQAIFQETGQLSFRPNPINNFHKEYFQLKDENLQLKMQTHELKTQFA